MSPDPGGSDSVEELRKELEADKERIAALEAEKSTLAGRGGDTDLAAARPDKRRRSHRFWVALLLVLGSVLTPVSILALFVKNEISDTSRYVQTIKPLSSNPAIQSYVADDVSKQLFAQVDIEQYVREALPTQARPLTGPLTNALQGFVRQATLRILQTSQFQTLWINANRTAHQQLVAVLTGKKSGAVTANKNGAVTVDLSAVTAQVKTRLQSTGISLFSKIPSGKIGGKITVFQSKDLYKVRRAFGVLNTLAFVLPFVVFACFGGAIYLSRRRRRAFVKAAVGFTLGALVLALLLNVGRSVYLNAATSTLPYDAAAAMYDTLVRFLHTSVRAAATFSIIVILVVFFAGPSRFAEWFRGRVRAAMTWLGAESDRAGWSWLSAKPFVVRHKGVFHIVVAVIAFVVLFRWKHPTPSIIFWIALVALLLLAIIEFFGRGTQIETPSPSPAA